MPKVRHQCSQNDAGSRNITNPFLNSVQSQLKKGGLGLQIQGSWAFFPWWFPAWSFSFSWFYPTVLVLALQCSATERGVFCYLRHFLASCSLFKAVKVACKSYIARCLHQLYVLLTPQPLACSQLYIEITNDILKIQRMGLVLKCSIYMVVFSPLLFSFRGSLCPKNIY